MNLFIEFYYELQGIFTNNELVYTINNSFASIETDIHEYIKIDRFYKTPKKVLEEYINIIDRYKECSSVFVSCLTIEDVVLTFLVADKFKEKGFLIGGTGSRYVYSIKKRGYNFDCPPNVEITPYKLSNYFILRKPKFRVPKDLDTKKFNFIYGVDTPCSWQKCKFCTDTFKCFGKKIYETDICYFAPTFPSNLFADYISITISTPNVTEDIFSKLVNVFNGMLNDVRFFVFIRADVDIDSIIMSGIDMKRFTFWIGLEFPGDRILSVINKGVTTEQYLRLAEKLTNSGATVIFGVIIGWPFIINNDVKEAEIFLSDKRLKSTYLNINRLYLTEYTNLGLQVLQDDKIFIRNQLKEISNSNLLNTDFYIKLKPDKNNLNNEVYFLLQHSVFEKIQDRYNMDLYEPFYRTI